MFENTNSIRMNESSLSEEELKNLIIELDSDQGLGQSESLRKRARVQATLLLHIYKVTNSLAKSSRILEKLTWVLAILTAVLVLKEIGVI